MRIHDVRVASRALIALWGLLLLLLLFGVTMTLRARRDPIAGTTAESALTPPQAVVPAPDRPSPADAVPPADELEPGLARLEVPRLGIAVLVVPGESADQLAHGSRTTPVAPALMGAEGINSKGSHCDNFFRFLSAVVPGDTIVVSTRESAELFIVEWAQPVAPDELNYEDGTSDQTLTIMTGYPFDVPNPTGRFVVRANPIDVHDTRRADASHVHRPVIATP